MKLLIAAFAGALVSSATPASATCMKIPPTCTAVTRACETLPAGSWPTTSTLVLVYSGGGTQCCAGSAESCHTTGGGAPVLREFMNTTAGPVVGEDGAPIEGLWRPTAFACGTTEVRGVFFTGTLPPRFKLTCGQTAASFALADLPGFAVGPPPLLPPPLPPSPPPPPASAEPAPNGGGCAACTVAPPRREAGGAIVIACIALVAALRRRR